MLQNLSSKHFKLKRKPIHTKARSGEQGAAMVIVLLMSSLLLIMMSTGLLMARNANKDTTEVFRTQGQAANVAQAGLQDAIAWFKRNQPVKQSTEPCKDAAFNPVHNASDPTLSDTDDANVGIVKDIQIKGNLYGRYIIKKQPCGAAEDPHAVHDVTAIKGKSSTLPIPTSSPGGVIGEGAVWYLESQGLLYLRSDFSKTNGVFVKGPSDAPNRLLRQANAAIEISRLTVNTDTAPVTVYATSGSNHSFGNRCRLIGGNTASAGVYYNGLNPTVNAVLSPTTMTSKQSRSAVSPENVFAVSASELRGMADNIYTDLSQVPEQLQKFSITYLDGNFTGANAFTNAKPLVGGGLLFVNGNLTLSDGSNSLYSGVVYVTGTLTMGRDNSIAGTVMARRVVCNPGSGFASFEYNNNLVTTVRQKLALYRENNLTHTYREH